MLIRGCLMVDDRVVIKSEKRGIDEDVAWIMNVPIL